MLAKNVVVNFSPLMDGEKKKFNSPWARDCVYNFFLSLETKTSNFSLNIQKVLRKSCLVFFLLFQN